MCSEQVSTISFDIIFSFYLFLYFISVILFSGALFFILRIKELYPDLLNYSIRLPLFGSVSGTSISSNPMRMAESYSVPYLGCIPMDRNLTASCENGEPFLETFPKSVASNPIRLIVDNILRQIGNH